MAFTTKIIDKNYNIIQPTFIPSIFFPSQIMPLIFFFVVESLNKSSDCIFNNFKLSLDC